MASEKAFGAYRKPHTTLAKKKSLFECVRKTIILNLFSTDPIGS